MNMNTNLTGRLRNTPLPQHKGLLPLFEAVVNSIHAVGAGEGDATRGEIQIDIERLAQTDLTLDDASSRRGAPPLAPISGFRIVDNGVGFDAANMTSFETLDSDHKAAHGCRGVGRLLWLKAFECVTVASVFRTGRQRARRRQFHFTAGQGIRNIDLRDARANEAPHTVVHLQGFFQSYREKSAKTARAIANSLFEHCLWYFVRDGGVPKIVICDGDEIIDLVDVYDSYLLGGAQRETLDIKGHSFVITHVKLKTSAVTQPVIAWCAASRVIENEPLSGKLPGLHGKLQDGEGDFTYACYVTSSWLDQHVRPERIGFDIPESSDDLFGSASPGRADIREALLAAAADYLAPWLTQTRQASRDRVERFVTHRAPRYRPILAHIDQDRLSVPPDISDRDLDLLLHRELANVEHSLIAEGHDIMQFASSETTEMYRQRLAGYIAKADDIKQSDLANYVFHRKTILDILAQALKRGEDGRFAREEVIHELFMPMGKSSEEVHAEHGNLWLLDERLTFHSYLASDKPLQSMPITDCVSGRKPDLCALKVFDRPMLMADGAHGPLASLVVVELKRPMRNDAAAGEDKDPVEQAIGYLVRIRAGSVTTPGGRPVPGAASLPGFCYVVCDITRSVVQRCQMLQLSETMDGMGFFGYNSHFKTYIEVISYDRLLQSAYERNRAFFDRLGLPSGGYPAT
ncbi:hypothetical protein AT302_08505 [Pandoraea norimbergensis]|uniref:ATP-binding protein n=2 Tax=Pandoraea norimbergensis TaxID=93219 RepID=A0ABN4JG84_9BURK|nr:hypothetical protein AT302_08505 [Pandoraea norimbergensis]